MTRVVGHYIKSDGTDEAGFIKIRPLVTSGLNDVVTNNPVVRELHNGAFEAEVIDSNQWNPPMPYIIEEIIPGHKTRRYSAILTGIEIDTADIEPMLDPSYVVVPGPQGPAGMGVLVLEQNEAVPEGTPVGTVILRRI